MRVYRVENRTYGFGPYMSEENGLTPEEDEVRYHATDRHHGATILNPSWMVF